MMKDTVRDTLVFASNAVSSFRETGSVFPTSRWAAEALTSPLRAHRIKDRPKRRILELGPGTGSVTIQILKDMRPEDELLICEINEGFMRALQENLNRSEEFHRNRDRVSFFLGAAQDLPEDGVFDVVVCALPFLNFDKQTIAEIFAKIMRVTNADSVMTYYEYIGLRKLGQVLPERRERMKTLLPIFESLKKARTEKKRIWLNMLPVNIYTMKPGAVNQASHH